MDIQVWTVEFSTQLPNQSYRKNHYYTVVSDSAQRVLEMIGERFPNAVIHALHKRSSGTLIVDPKVVLADAPPDEG